MTLQHFNQVETARVAFASRWQPSSIAVVDSELYERFMEQLNLWDEACAVGDVEEIEIQAGGMIRAYAAATKLLEGHRRTAYLSGNDIERGKTVCISAHSESVAYAKAETDFDVVWVTPDAVARLVCRAQEMGIIIDDKEDRLS